MRGWIFNRKNIFLSSSSVNVKIFLTGASGYVGRHVAQELLDRGHEVVGLARKSSPATERLNGVSWCFGNLAEHNDFEGEIDQADAIIHCAMDYSEDGKENSALDAKFVRLLRAKGKYFVYTGNLYAKRQSPEDTFPEEAIAVGGDWRLQQENSIVESGGAAIIRLAFVYGGQGGYLWLMFPPPALSGLDLGEITPANWPMVHVHDVATLFATVVEQQRTGVYHAYDGNEITAKELARTLQDVYPKEDSATQEPHEHIVELLSKSIKTTNARSLSTGWAPRYDNFAANASRAYESYLGSL